MSWIKQRIGAMLIVCSVVLGLALLSTPSPGQQPASKSFEVYFPHGESKVTPEAYQLAIIISEEAPTDSKIVIVGYCDTSEASPQELSRKRAENLAAAIHAAGLGDGIAVEINGSGAKGLAVSTPPDTREPLNERAHVEIQPLAR